MLMTTMQLPGTSTNDSQIVIHATTSNAETNVARVFQNNNISDPTLAHELIDHGKDRKQSSNSKWMEREYHVQVNKYVQHKSVQNHGF